MINEDEQMVYVLWRAGFTLRDIGRVFEMHPQEVKNTALKVAKVRKRLAYKHTAPTSVNRDDERFFGGTLPYPRSEDKA